MVEATLVSLFCRLAQMNPYCFIVVVCKNTIIPAISKEIGEFPFFFSWSFQKYFVSLPSYSKEYRHICSILLTNCDLETEIYERKLTIVGAARTSAGFTIDC